MSDSVAIPLPLEFVIEATPVSAQASSPTREAWKATVSQAARERLSDITDWYWLEKQPLSVTIFYFPDERMEGDIDNIAKPILDGMKAVVYHDDDVVERVLVQRFEPDVAWSFQSLPEMLVVALDRVPPIVYIRIDGDLAWRQVP